MSPHLNKREDWMKDVACSRTIKIISTLLGHTLAIRKYILCLARHILVKPHKYYKYIRGEGGVDFDIAVRAIKQTRLCWLINPLTTNIDGTQKRVTTEYFMSAWPTRDRGRVGSNDELPHGCLLLWGLDVEAVERGYPEEGSSNT